MGGSKDYIASGGFKNQQYKQTGIAGGVKILEKIGNGNADLPMHSNTPNTMYAVRKPSDGSLKQVAIYGQKDGRTKIKDIDWGHSHKNKGNKLKFERDEFHVQEYINNVRQADARKLSKKEKRIGMLVRYGGNKT